MPIRPDQRHRYPRDWPTISHLVRRAAGWRCQDCRVADRSWGWRDAMGSFQPVSRDLFYPGIRPPFRMMLPIGDVVVVREVVLTVAHLDHQPENNTPENLRALCQRCHLNHDRPYHYRVRLQRLRAAMRTLELPLRMAA